MRVLVTGAGSDIGLAIARHRLGLGDSVIVTASSEESLARVKQGLQDLRPSVEGFVFRLEAPEASLAALERGLAGGIDAVVLNAASRLTRLREFHQLKDSEFDQFVGANIFGNTWLLRKLVPHFLDRSFGRIVFVSSVTVPMGAARYAPYNAAKAAVEGVCLSLAVEYGSRNVLANVVRLGIIKTARNQRYWSRPDYVEKATARIPQGKLGEPAQVAEAIAPLLSPTSYLNGCLLNVSGGFPLVVQPA